MREPPLGLEVVPDPALELFFDEDHHRPRRRGSFFVGLYHHGRPGARSRRSPDTMADTNPLADAPSVRSLPVRAAGIGRHDGVRRQASIESPRSGTTRLAAMLQLVRRTLDQAPRRHRRRTWTEPSERTRRQAPERVHSRDALCVRPGAPPRRTVSRTSGTRGSTPRPSSTTPDFDAQREIFDDALISGSPRGRRPRDDGGDHRGNEGPALGLLPRHDAATLGTRRATP